MIPRKSRHMLTNSNIILNNIIILIIMSSNSQTEEQSQFEIDKKQNKRNSKGKSKSKQKKQESSKKNEKAKKKGGKKQVKQKKQVKKKKPSKSKPQIQTADSSIVKQYMQKMNRPFSSKNIYENLHGKIKMPILESMLDELVKDKNIVCKEFGKSKVYFLNQDNFDFDQNQVDETRINLNQNRQLNVELQQVNKELANQYSTLMGRKTKEQIQALIQKKKQMIQILNAKKAKLENSVSEMMEEEVVLKEEKEVSRLQKELKKFRRVKKQFLEIISEAYEKKIPQMADIIGLEI